MIRKCCERGSNSQSNWENITDTMTSALEPLGYPDVLIALWQNHKVYNYEKNDKLPILH